VLVVLDLCTVSLRTRSGRSVSRCEHTVFDFRDSPWEEVLSLTHFHYSFDDDLPPDEKALSQVMRSSQGSCFLFCFCYIAFARRFSCESFPFHRDLDEEVSTLLLQRIPLAEPISLHGWVAFLRPATCEPLSTSTISGALIST